MRICFPQVLVTLILASASGCSSSQTHIYDADHPDLRDLILAPLPSWARPSQDTYNLDIDRIMQREKQSRYEAVEVQSLFRSALMDPKVSIVDAYTKAVSEVRAAKFSSGWHPLPSFEPSDFILAFSLEAVSSPFSGGLKYLPAIQKTVRELRRNPHCRAVAVFSSLPIVEAKRQVSGWEAGLIDGVFGLEHEVVGKGVVTPSRDLRILDPTLLHVVMIDLARSSVLQPELLWTEPPFNSQRFEGAAAFHETPVMRYYQGLMKFAVTEVEEASQASKQSELTFVQAFFPYSALGRKAFEEMIVSTGSRRKALSLARAKPELLR